MTKWRKENPEKVLEIQRRNYANNGKKYNDLGLADYAAIEAFKRYHF